MTHTVGGTALD